MQEDTAQSKQNMGRCFTVSVLLIIVPIEFVEMLIREKLASGDGLAGASAKSCSALTRQAFRECVVRGGRILPILLTTLTALSSVAWNAWLGIL